MVLCGVCFSRVFFCVVLLSCQGHGLVINYRNNFYSSQIFVGTVYTNGCAVYTQTSIVCTRGGAGLCARSHAIVCVRARKSV